MGKRLLIAAAVLGILLIIMGFFGRLFSTKLNPATDTPAVADPEHAVLIHIPLASQNPTREEMNKWQAVQSEMETAIKSAHAGELDGDEWGMGDFTIYCYGRDADRLWAAIQPVLAKAHPPTGTYAIKRYGPPGASEKRVERTQTN